MRRLLLALACAAALCAPSATTAGQAAGVPVATPCAGSVIVKVKGTSVRAGSIRTTKVSCRAGKALIGSLLTKVGSSPACRRAADRPPPTTGCIVTGYHCFRKRNPDYCSTVPGKFVQWRESHLLSGKPPRAHRERAASDRLGRRKAKPMYAVPAASIATPGFCPWPTVKCGVAYAGEAMTPTTSAARTTMPPARVGGLYPRVSAGRRAALCSQERRRCRSRAL